MKEKKETNGKEINYGEERGCSIEGEENEWQGREWMQEH
jgi:hypothetical protein